MAGSPNPHVADPGFYPIRKDGRNFSRCPYVYYGMFLNYIGRAEEGLDLLETAYRLDPIAPTAWDMIVGYSHWELHRFDEAVMHFRNVIERVPGMPMTYLFLASVYMDLGQDAEASELVRALLAMNPRWTLREVDRIFPIRSDQTRQRFLDNLQKAGLAA